MNQFKCNSQNKEEIPITNASYSSLLQRNELRRVSSTNTRTVVLHRLVRQRELAQIVTDHLSLDFNVVEVATVVHTNNRTNHLGNHDHVTQVSLHRVRTLVLRSLSLLYLNTGNYNTHSLTQSLDQRLRLSLQTTTESATSTSLHIHQYSLNNKPLTNTYINQFHQILWRHIQQLVQIHSTVCELLERSLLLLLSVHFNILILTHCYHPLTHNTSPSTHYTHKHATTIRNHAVSIILLHTITNTLTSSLMMANGNDS